MRGSLVPRLLGFGLVLLAVAAVLLLASAPSPKAAPRPPRPRGGIVPVLSIDGPGQGRNPRFSRPLDAAFGPDGRIYVADTGNDRICVFSPRGGFLFAFGGPGIAKPASTGQPTWRPGTFNFPTGIDVDEGGRIYVADMHNDQIQVFTRDGSFMRAFPDRDTKVGRGSSGRGGGIAVTDVAVRDGVVAATDTFQVLMFDTEGRLLGQFGKPGRGDGDLDHPNGIAIGEDGTVFVSDSNHARVVAFRADGRVQWVAGRIPPGPGSREPGGTFGLPRGLAVAGDGLVVADSFRFELVRLSRTGKVLERAGVRGSALGEFNFPSGLDVRGRDALVCDRANNRVQVVRFERAAAR